MVIILGLRLLRRFIVSRRKHLDYAITDGSRVVVDAIYGGAEWQIIVN